MSNTVEQFWRMIDQHNISVIFMLCLLEENGKVQCFRYWPDITKPDSCLELSELRIYPVVKTELAPNLIEKKLRMVSKLGKPDREIVQYQVRVFVG